jgi:P2 family phage major capsid protein
MKDATRVKFNAYTGKIQTLNGVADVTKKFSVAPTIQQTLEQKMQESSAFLTRINIVPVDEMQGNKVGLGISGPISSNTDTSGSGERQTSDPSTLDEDGYHCRKNNSDTHLTYAKLDLWAKFPNFQTMIRDQILKRQALDRMMIGFNGTSYAVNSNKTTNPMLQDVNIGWLQQYRDNAPARVMSEVVPSSGKVTVKAGGDYENLDALVFDAVNNLIEPQYQEDPDLVVVMGRQLLADKYFPMINQDNPATEQLATDIVVSQKRVGNLPAVRVPFFPAGAVYIGPLSGLSIYYQEGKRRRHLEENAKRDRIENYESSNDAYVVEEYARGCVVENIDTTPAA